MRLALISDVHANFEALQAVADVLTDVDRVLCLGDLVGYYCQVTEVLDYVRSLEPLCVLGNHDNYLLHGCPSDAGPAVRFGIEFAQRVVDESHRRWLSSWPMVWGGSFGGRSFLLAHGSPWDPLDDYLYSDSPKLGALRAFDYDFLAFGQTHRVMIAVEGRPILLNPGSVGQSRDAKARASVLVVDTDEMSIERISRTFDASTVVEIARMRGAKEWIHKHLL